MYPTGISMDSTSRQRNEALAARADKTSVTAEDLLGHDASSDDDMSDDEFDEYMRQLHMENTVSEHDIIDKLDSISSKFRKCTLDGGQQSTSQISADTGKNKPTRSGTTQDDIPMEDTASANTGTPTITDTADGDSDDEYLADIYANLVRSHVTDKMKERICNTSDIYALYTMLESIRLSGQPYNHRVLTRHGVSFVSDTKSGENTTYTYSMNPCYKDHLEALWEEKQRREEEERILKIAEGDLEDERVANEANYVRTEEESELGVLSDAQALNLLVENNTSRGCPSLHPGMFSKAFTDMETIPEESLPNYLTDHAMLHITTSSDGLILDVYFTIQIAE